MATATVYATANAEGSIEAVGSDFDTWANVRSGTSLFSLTAYKTQDRYFCVNADWDQGWTTKRALARGFRVYDLAGQIPVGSTVTAAELYEYVYGKSSAAGGNVCLVASTQASVSDLTTADYGAVGTTEYMSRTTGLGGAATTFANLTTSAYNIFTLNAAGIAVVQAAVGGNLKLAYRASHDLDNSAPGAGTRSYMATSFMERAGGSEDPYIVVTYTPPPSAAAMRRRPSGLIAPARFVR